MLFYLMSNTPLKPHSEDLLASSLFLVLLQLHEQHLSSRQVSTPYV